MKRALSILSVSLLSPLVVAAGAAAVPTWMFFVPSAQQPVETARRGVYTIPGSMLRRTQAQIDDLKNPPDWLPSSHPVPPRAVVKGGAAPMAWACGSCHLMSGMGHPESSSLAGQPLGYLKGRMAEFRSPRPGPRVRIGAAPPIDAAGPMIPIAKSWSKPETDAALAYFAAMKARPWVRVVETATVPKTYIDRAFMRVPHPKGGTEPLGQRIVELPANVERVRLRDPRVGTVAYVPVGSVQRGKAIVVNGAMPCAACHGAKLTGQGNFPAIAGRSPLYNARQLYFFKQGVRNGPMASGMRAAAAGMSDRDRIDVSAYLATLAP